MKKKIVIWKPDGCVITQHKIVTVSWNAAHSRKMHKITSTIEHLESSHSNSKMGSDRVHNYDQ